MNVIDMISLMRTQGIGENFNDDETQRRYLSYLNLAHDELYSKTAAVNPYVLNLLDNVHNQAGEARIALGEVISVVSLIIQNGKTKDLELISFPKFILYKAQNPNYSDPKVCSLKGRNEILFYPYVGGDLNFSLLYAPQRTPFEINTLEAQVPYPPEYHRVLVDGALYYVFQDEGPFRSSEKESNAAKRWQEGIDKLMIYFTGINQETINTFSEL